jgi:hypothetical protein
MKKRHSQVMAEAWSRCDKFNSVNPIGTKIEYRTELDSEVKQSTIQSEAWAIPNGDAVVTVAGRISSVSLDHIEVI